MSLPDESPSPGAKGDPDRHLATPRQGARRQHRGHVHARDQQHRDRRTHEQRQEGERHAAGIGRQARHRRQANRAVP
jgi:hypothetical protein